MKCTMSSLRNKEIINIKTGSKLGYVDDAEINTSDSQILSFIVFGRSRFFGLFGKEDDIVIKCEDIQIVGTDTILVSVDDVDITKKDKFDIKSLYK